MVDVSRTEVFAVVRALRAVPGVADAQEESPADAPATGFRLRLSPGADALEVAGAVSLLLHQQLGPTGDHSRAHVVQIRPDGEKPAAAVVPRQPWSSGPRALIVSTHVVTRGSESNAAVVLASGSRTATGEARAVAVSTAVHRALAQATLLALQELLAENASLELQQVEMTESGTSRVVLVHLTLMTPQGPERLTGAAAVRDDEYSSVVRATLDASNRRILRLLS